MNQSRQQIYESIYAEENRSCDEPAYCSVFGCGEVLSLFESLCGDRCINHQKNIISNYEISKEDINLAIKQSLFFS